MLNRNRFESEPQNNGKGDSASREGCKQWRFVNKKLICTWKGAWKQSRVEI